MKIFHKNKFLRSLLRLLSRLILIAIAVYILLEFIVCITIVHNTDNFPHVKDGDLVIGLRLTESYTNDLVMYDLNGKTKVGRIVGVAGDEIDIPEDDIYYTVNGTIPYEVIYSDTKKANSSVEYPLVIPEDSYFVLNDNRTETSDSREFGVLPKDNILAKVVFILRRRGF